MEEDNYNSNYYYPEEEDVMMEDEEYMEDEDVYMDEEYEMVEEPCFAEKHPMIASLILSLLESDFVKNKLPWIITIVILYFILKACA